MRWQLASRASCHFHFYPANWMQTIFFAAFMMWSFYWKAYPVQLGEHHTSPYEYLAQATILGLGYD